MADGARQTVRLPLKAAVEAAAGLETDLTLRRVPEAAPARDALSQVVRLAELAPLGLALGDGLGSKLRVEGCRRGHVVVWLDVALGEGSLLCQSLDRGQIIVG